MLDEQLSNDDNDDDNNNNDNNDNKSIVKSLGSNWSSFKSHLFQFWFVFDFALLFWVSPFMGLQFAFCSP